MTDIVIETPTPDDLDAIFRVVYAAFLDEPSEDAAKVERLIIEIDRSLVARCDGEIVGTAGIHTRQLAVPGGVLPAAHVTMVSVVPTARRQGVLTRFMRRQFDDSRAAGEPIAALWASEGRIYQRFGYGLAATKIALTIDTNEVTLTLPTPTGGLREGSPASVRDSLVKLYDEVYATRPGWSERAERHWDYRLADLKEWRRGGTELRAIIHEDANGVDGYALWRGQGRWSDTGAAASAGIDSSPPHRRLRLWQFLLTVTSPYGAVCRAPDERRCAGRPAAGAVRRRGMATRARRAGRPRRPPLRH